MANGEHLRPLLEAVAQTIPVLISWNWPTSALLSEDAHCLAASSSPSRPLLVRGHPGAIRPVYELRGLDAQE